MRTFLTALLASFSLVVFLLPTHAQSLSDVSGYDWEYSIQYLLDEGIIQGYEDGSYRPDATINRAEFTKIMVEGAFFSQDFAGAADDCFPDVSREDWFAKYVCFAQEMGIVSGHGDGMFRPGEEVTQAAALKILLETFYEGIPDAEGDWYDKYLAEAEFSGMLYFGGESAPGHLLTRGEMAYFITWTLDEGSPDQIDYDDFYDSVAYVFEFDEDFAWEALSEEDCFDDEFYDPVDQMCYVWVDGEELGEDFDPNQYYEEFEEQYGDYFDDLYDDSYDIDEEHHQFSLEDGAESYVRYNVSGDVISFAENVGDVQSSDLLTDQSKHQMIWDEFARLIPRSHRQELFYEFQVFTDGPEGFMAFVTQDENDSTRWVLGVDVADAFDASGQLDKREFPMTLAHEYAHVMTLNHEQVNHEVFDGDDDAAYGRAEQNCRPQYFTGEGCSKVDSFINVFFKKFWGGKVYQDWLALQQEHGEEFADSAAAEEATFKFYQQYQTHFVTDYAATNVGEDIAEAFAYFVFKDKPTGADIRDQKVQFFYDFPGLVKLR